MGEPVVCQQRFYVSMSDKDSHCNHNTGTDCAHYVQPVNSDVEKNCTACTGGCDFCANSKKLYKILHSTSAVRQQAVSLIST